MTKSELTLLIVTAALRDCDNHILRLAMINTLADKNCQPLQFKTIENKSFWLFTVANQDFEYQNYDQHKWSVTPATSKYALMERSQPLELID